MISPYFTCFCISLREVQFLLEKFPVHSKFKFIYILNFFQIFTWIIPEFQNFIWECSFVFYIFFSLFSNKTHFWSARIDLSPCIHKIFCHVTVCEHFLPWINNVAFFIGNKLPFLGIPVYVHPYIFYHTIFSPLFWRRCRLFLAYSHRNISLPDQNMVVHSIWIELVHLFLLIDASYF